MESQETKELNEVISLPMRTKWFPHLISQTRGKAWPRTDEFSHRTLCSVIWKADVASLNNTEGEKKIFCKKRPNNQQINWTVWKNNTNHCTSWAGNFCQHYRKCPRKAKRPKVEYMYSVTAIKAQMYSNIHHCREVAIVQLKIQATHRFPQTDSIFNKFEHNVTLIKSYAVKKVRNHHKEGWCSTDICKENKCARSISKNDTSKIFALFPSLQQLTFLNSCGSKADQRDILTGFGPIRLQEQRKTSCKIFWWDHMNCAITLPSQ